MNRLPNLDPLRFVLASIVMLYHIPQLCKNQGLPYFDDLHIFHKGIEAVYMFFVLSGFLIIRLIYRAKQNNTFSIGHFYIRRILRIFPLYYLVVIFGFLFYNVVLPALQIPFEINYSFGEGLFLTLFFLPNIFAELYYPGGILEILWSIGIEEQFYLIIAPLLFFTDKGKILKILLLLTFLYFVIFHVNYFDVLRKFNFVYFMLFFGGIIAILEEMRKLEFLKISPIIPIIIIGSTIVYFTTNVFDFNSIWINNLFMSSLFALCIHSLACNNFNTTITIKALIYLGQISYGIYMYHIIALNLVVFVFLKIDYLKTFNEISTRILILLLTFAITIAMAHISYKYFESYFLKQKSKFRK